LLPELSELFNGLSAFAGLRPFFDNHLLRLEDESKEGVYEVRAELAGVDPIEDVEVTVRDGRLTIKALRMRTTESNGISEFSYGSFTRTVTLPDSADEDDINATYDRGILTVSVPLSDEPAAAKHVGCTRSHSSTRTMRTTRTTPRMHTQAIPKATISTNRAKGPDRLPWTGWKPPNSSPSCKDVGSRC
jgi:HSP20 family molecular chaperone IbpA